MKKGSFVAALYEIQTEFKRALLDSARPVPRSIGRCGGKPAARRFSVYRNNVVMSLTDVLESYFPVVARLVGTEYFAAMVRAFIIAHPPRTPVLTRYPIDFPAFIGSFLPVADLPYLRDIAQLEWQQLCAYHAADSAPLVLSELGGIRPPQLGATRLTLRPSTSAISSNYPVFSIWRTNTFDQSVCAIAADSAREDVLVSRIEVEVRTVLLPPGAYAFIRALSRGETLAGAAASATSSRPHFDLQTSLTILLEAEAISATAPGEGEFLISASETGALS